jgi:hypothetical protein
VAVEVVDAVAVEEIGIHADTLARAQRAAIRERGSRLKAAISFSSISSCSQMGSSLRRWLQFLMRPQMLRIK